MHYSIKYVALAVLALISLSSCAEQAALPGKAFEGTITQVIKLPGLAKTLGGLDSGSKEDRRTGALLGAASTVSLKIHTREDKLAYEVAAFGGFIKSRFIIDRATRTLTMLTPDKKAYVTDLKAMDTIRERLDDSIRKNQQMVDSIGDALPKPTGRTQEINGFEVEEYVGRMQGMDVEMWLTSDPRMKFYEVLRDAILGKRRTGTGGLEEIFAMIAPLTDGKVPVQFTSKLNGEVFATSELTKIEEEELDDKLFEIPAGYQIVRETPGGIESSHDTAKRSITGRKE